LPVRPGARILVLRAADHRVTEIPDIAKLKWNLLFSRIENSPVVYDLWLDKYMSMFSESDLPVLDLGCGSGNNTKYLDERGVKVISSDYSEAALGKVSKDVPTARIVLHDMRNPLPFSDGCTKCVIADLSLHYFPMELTRKILNEIDRILIPGGLFIFRVNSIHDKNYGAGVGKELEKNYFLHQGARKRFFDEETLDSIIDGRWETVNRLETEVNRYGKPKIAWEVALRKKC